MPRSGEPKEVDLPAPRSPKDSQRIAKLLARAGIASRREIERMIADGRVAINGATVETPATLLTSLHGVTVDGQPVKAPAPARLFLYHKPTGVLTAERDPAGRPTIYDRMPKGLPRLMPVGRLDLNTEGLLLLTTDGGLKRQLELPSSGVERIYRARTFGDVSQEQLEELIHGVEIEGIRYGSIDANLERRTGRNQWIEVRITEGKNREVRRVLEHLGLKVSRLIRVAYGPFTLGGLPPGEVEEIRQHDLVAFRRDLTGGSPAALKAGTAIPRPEDFAPRPRRPRGEGAEPSEPRPARPRRAGAPSRRPQKATGGPVEREARPERSARARKPFGERDKLTADRGQRAERKPGPRDSAGGRGRPGRGTGRTDDERAGNPRPPRPGGPRKGPGPRRPRG